jgi:subfamily B ATP-binding cassette protein HlyB/CyaB
LPEAGTHGGASNDSLHRALDALCLAARLHRINAEPKHLEHVLGLNGSAWAAHRPDGPIAAAFHHKLEGALLLAANHIGLRAKCVDLDLQRLPFTPLPALVRTHAGEWVLLARSGADAHLIYSPELGRTQQVDEAALLDLTGSQPGQRIRAVLLASRESIMGSLAQFDFSWFIPSLVKHRRLFGKVMLASVLLQLFALITPLFFQVVMDKVLIHEGFSTLNVITIGLLVIMVFESVLNLLRSYVFSHTTSRMDVELGSRLFRHLLALPLPYFQSRRVGDTVARVRELDSIRSFLTGQSLTLVLDVVFSIVFIVVMLFYSVPLTLIVLASIPAYVGLSVLVVPVLRKRLEEKFQRGTDSQAMLVEAINGIQTIKASALEPQIGNRWDEKLAGYVSSSLRAVTLSNAANEGVSFIGKLVSLGTLWLGAHLVIAGDLTLGMFIAFNMFAGRVAQPIMRLAQLWTEFQQVGISMARLADVLNAPTEAPPSHVAQLPTLAGRITFDNVSFRYSHDSPNVLSDIKLDIHPGQVIGIVGRSGSGKSTLTKLVQRLYVPSAGRLAGPDRYHRPARRCTRLHQRVSARLRHAGGRAWRQPLGRSKTAHRHCPSPVWQSEGPDL